MVLTPWPADTVSILALVGYWKGNEHFITQKPSDREVDQFHTEIQMYTEE